MKKLLKGMAKSILFYVYLFAFISCAGSLLAFLHEKHYAFEILDSLRYQFILSLAAGLAASLLEKRKRMAVLFIAFTGLNLAVAYNPSPASLRDNGSGESLSILSANLFYRNSELDGVVKLVKELQPDVIFFYEMREESRNRLKELEKDYPFQRTLARDDGFGIAFYSRISPGSSHVLFTEQLGVPYILARVKGFTVYGIHPLHPSNREYTEDRNSLMKSIKPEDDLVVTGDMNAVPWSGIVRDTKKRLQLKDVKTGFRTLVPTWGPPGLYLLGLPIDNCLVSDKLRIEEFRIVGFPGSDHRALWVRVER